MEYVIKHDEMEIQGTKYFREQYTETGFTTYLWRYGYYLKTGGKEYAYLISDMLRSRPNLKRLYGQR